CQQYSHWPQELTF
nr:immunoglobulin light chain junction region [Macaca mulatta]MOX91127.1 immunoglobulin light chain junction region [Macaca mulatta]